MTDNNRKQLIFDTFDNKETERVPVGFWFHFVFDDAQFRGLEDRSVLDRVMDGHKEFYDAFNPDFVKIMSDGFFGHPSLLEKKIEQADDLYNVKAVGPDHPWITEQVKTVKRIKESFNGEVATFYNIFSPANYIRIAFEAWDKEPEKFPRFFEEAPEALAYAANEIAKDIALLSRKVIEEAGADGIYLSVQNVQSSAATKEAYQSYIAPSELDVLAAANAASDYNILHICGYQHYQNDLSFYQDYEAKAYNWAVHTEKVSLKEGKEFFGNKAVIGGFDNNSGTLLDSGDKADIAQFTADIIQTTGDTGVIIGADCTVDPAIELDRLELVRQTAAGISGKNRRQTTSLHN
ncbi:uroporphyrinogen decarboxylase [Trichococcus patagoniensis]|uniref:Uroporphyrinogen decarboxylase n=1 Tax=Trichococcus patagoniensis TaxID=382641 RepID=A0A2T5INL2_9LACT|nr:uroporphyrinogen decarboxylase family protein [Trichococcus patagoniensis]PTQ85399.1 uroporphyrinogen decarboxylase [Trichococcus patagoniensis]